MKMNPKIVMSDEFIEFSQKIKELHKQKEEAKLEFKKIYEEFQIKDKEIEDKVQEITEEFEEWASQQEEND